MVPWLRELLFEPTQTLPYWVFIDVFLFVQTWRQALIIRSSAQIQYSNLAFLRYIRDPARCYGNSPVHQYNAMQMQEELACAHM